MCFEQVLQTTQFKVAIATNRDNVKKILRIYPIPVETRKKQW